MSRAPCEAWPAGREGTPLACVCTLTVLAAAPGKEINLRLPSGREWGPVGVVWSQLLRQRRTWPPAVSGQQKAVT